MGTGTWSSCPTRAKGSWATPSCAASLTRRTSPSASRMCGWSPPGTSSRRPCSPTTRMSGSCSGRSATRTRPSWATTASCSVTIPPRRTTAALTTIEAGRGYWIRETVPAPPPDAAEPWHVLPVATLRLAGQRVPVDQPLPLAAGWNLAGYLPQTSLPVTEALGSIEGTYGAVLGFDRTGVSYYPDLDGRLQHARRAEAVCRLLDQRDAGDYPAVPDHAQPGGDADRTGDRHLAAQRPPGRDPGWRSRQQACIRRTLGRTSTARSYLPDGTPAPDQHDGDRARERPALRRDGGDGARPVRTARLLRG